MLGSVVGLSLIYLSSLGGVLGGSPSLQSILGDSNIEAYFPDEPGYLNASRAFNLRVDFKPAVVAYPNSTEEVAVLVKAGALLGLPVNARSGGHSYAGYGLGGEDDHVIVDLSNFSDTKVDNATGIAVVGAGSRLGDIAVALFNQAGRAIPHGTCPLVGIGGHASFGGYGFTSRQWGFTLDTMVGATVVLANGTIVNASATTHSDLFWALRGAGPSFGIVTHFYFQTYEAPAQPTFFSYVWSLPLEQAIEGISTYQDFSFSSSIPSEMGFELDLTKGTNEGEISLHLVGSYYGDPDQFPAIIQPFLDSMPNLTSPAHVNVTSWLDNLIILAGGSLASTPASVAIDGSPFYAKSLSTPSDYLMSQEAITAMASWMSFEGWYTSTSWFVQLELYGGASSRIGQIPWNATAYVNREDVWTIQFYTSSANTETPFPREGFAFLDGLVASITANEPESYDYGAYPNYVDPRLPPPEWHALYYGSNLQRLQQIKTAIDPQNVFRWPQSIPLYQRISG